MMRQGTTRRNVLTPHARSIVLGSLLLGALLIGYFLGRVGGDGPAPDTPAQQGDDASAGGAPPATAKRSVEQAGNGSRRLPDVETPAGRRLEQTAPRETSGAGTAVWPERVAPEGGGEYEAAKAGSVPSASTAGAALDGPSGLTSGASDAGAPARDPGAGTAPPPYVGAPGSPAGPQGQDATTPDTTLVTERDALDADEEDSSSDRLPPVIQGLWFDPPTITDGGATTLRLRITDEGAGVKKVSGRISSPGGTGVLEFVAQGHEGGVEFIARIVIPPRAETGAWFVSRLIIVDKADNWLDAPFTAATVPAGGTLNVSSADSDSTPPDVRNAWLEKGTVYDGESNTITIQIDDDRSEVAWVLGSFKSRTTGALVPFNCSAGPVAGIWQGAIQAPSSADCGEWRLFALRFADTAGNVGEMVEGSRLLPRVVFVVVSSQCDSSPPTLGSLSLSPTVVSSDSATDVQIAVTVYDEGSGMKSVSGHLRGPDGPGGQFAQIYFSCAPSGGDPAALWTGKITMPQSATRGTWRFGLLRLTDNAKNTHDYWLGDPATAEVTLEVQ